MAEAFVDFKETPSGDSPDLKHLFPSQAWNQTKARLQFLALTGEVCSGNSIAARTLIATLSPNLYKVLYLHWAPGSTLDLLRQLALDLDLELAHRSGDLGPRIPQPSCASIRAKSSVPFSSMTKPSCCAIPCLTTSPAAELRHGFELLSDFAPDGPTASAPHPRLQMHEPLRQRVAVEHQFESLASEESDAYLAHQFNASGVTQPLFDAAARQAFYQTTKGILRKVNKPALTALRQAASRKVFEDSDTHGHEGSTWQRRAGALNGGRAFRRA